MPPGSACRARSVGVRCIARPATPGPSGKGGDRRSGRTEAHADLILGLLEAQSDITLAELRAGLAERIAMLLTGHKTRAVLSATTS